ncbi:MAG: hypothetical protein A2452_03510 [Candidatus Firestonebacteria bacterium RIFOXYC2_FULL_39_67]|nr:MAG: hypothetical protein A2536_02925 [Candidatus Firestonebacteria bacterium RIFOXYD2_FULL_39_29]OGF55335.1 MAG: hypothetical protein A2452_03510 [Candidatus Firestonebacteria bacterium RIFOXYC2_FULL_39_67]OGF57471.1 MAG: hypothetical protein A2497_06460 [Candidatus Firestonebacteria bacterium RifOxyC12_full_39_7]
MRYTLLYIKYTNKEVIFLKSRGCFAAFFLLLASHLYAVDITISAVSVSDSLGISRPQYSSTEPLNLNIKCTSTKDVLKINFTFTVKDPAGKQVLNHTGNSILGKVGPGGSSLKNLPMTFYTIPGTYTFTGTVTTNESATDSKSVTFTVTSPYVTLFYPPNNIKDLNDSPLTFRWVASGASTYNVYVDTSTGFSDPIWLASSTLNSIQYPDNPSNPRQKLNADTVYWWKVTGLDGSGKVVASTKTPFNFTVKVASQPVLIKDIAATNIGLIDWTGSFTDKLYAFVKQDLKIAVRVENKGNTAQSSIAVRLFIDSKQSGEVKTVDFLEIGAAKNVEFTFKFEPLREGIFMPTVSGLVDFKDDNDRNNMITKGLQIEPDTAEISGRVTIKNTQLGLAGASVSYDNLLVKGEVLTDSNGNYKLLKLPVGTGMLYKLKASKLPAFKADEKSVTLLDKTAKVQNFEVDFNKSFVKGKIKDKKGKYLQGVLVVLTNNKTAEKFNITTTETGEYIFNDIIPADVDDREYSVDIELKGFKKNGMKVKVFYSKENDVDLDLEEEALVQEVNILGRVVGEDGKGLADVSISYDGVQKGEVKTSEGGNFLIKDAVIGKYILKLSKTGYLTPALFSVELKEKKAFVIGADIKLSLAKSFIKGKIQDKKGNLLKDVKVLLANNKTEEKNSTTTNDKGEYGFTSLLPSDIDDREYTIDVELTGYIKNSAKAKVLLGKEQSIDLEMEEEPPVNILGKVVGGDGKGLAEVVISFDGALKGEVKTNEGGNFLIKDAIIGKYTLKIAKTGYKVPAPLEVELKEKKAFVIKDDIKLLVEPVNITKEQVLSVFKELLKSNQVVLEAINGYELTDIETKGDLTEIMKNLSGKKSVITDVKIEVEP